MLLLNKANFAVLNFVSKEESRYMQVTPEYTCATNGHILGRVTTPNQKVADNFPSIPGFTPNGHTPFLMSKTTAERVAKAIPKDRVIPVLNHAAVSVDSESGEVTAAVTDLSTPQVFSQPKLSGQFPNSEQLWPKTDPITEVTLNPDYMIALAKAAKQLGANRVTLKLYGPDKALYFEAKGDEGQKLDGLLMPMTLL